MRVVCDGCQAKYQIPEDRVAGRKLKIRCRKCGEAILIRGDQLAAEAVTKVVDGSHGLYEWHVSIDGNPHGPYPLAQTAEMLRDGQLVWEVHVWREGYDEWKLASESDTLVRSVAALVTAEAPTTSAALPDSHEEAPTRMVQSSIVVEGGLQASAREAFSARVSRSRSSPPAVMHAAPTLTGERNEDSVLFSSRNIRASVAPRAVRNGHASGEGSGLIDIRALSALARSTSTPPAPSVRGATAPVMAFANRASAFGQPDSLKPVVRPARRTRSKALPIAIVSGSATIAVAALAAVVLTQRQPSPMLSTAAALPPVSVPGPVAVAQALPATEPVAPSPVPVEAPEQAEVSAPADALVVADTTSAPIADGSPKAATKRAQARATKSRSSARAAKLQAKTQGPLSEEEVAPKEAPKKAGPSVDELLLDDPKTAAPAPESATPKAAEPARERSIDELLSGAVPSKTKAPATDTGSAAPTSPTRDQVLAAMRSVQSEVRACGQGATLDQPSVKVAIKVIGASGKVVSARAQGIEGPLADCVERAVSGANFDPFSKPEFTVTYPFKL